jgi:hypothetical protein
MPRPSQSSRFDYPNNIYQPPKIKMNGAATPLRFVRSGRGSYVQEGKKLRTRFTQG